MANTRKRSTPQMAVQFEVQAHAWAAHVFDITCTIAQPAALQRVQLPVWIAGSYMVREFSKQLFDVRATQSGRNLAVVQHDKATWDIAADPSQTLVLNYRVHAHDNSVRTAWLDGTRGFFNGTSLFVWVHGQRDALHGVHLNPAGVPTDWRVATALLPLRTNAKGWGEYQATDYDELVDTPVELGAFWSGSFEACGVPHRFVVAGSPPSFDAARLLRDTQRICETHIRFWHGEGKTTGRVAAPVHDRYVFMLNAVDNGYGGLEHRHSTALIAQRSDLPRVGEGKTSEGYVTLLGLISHEYFHTWNVKRLRPREFERYDWARENHTTLLWFFEGLTSYYDDLLLRRSGLMDNTRYLQGLNKTINQVLQTPGRHVHSLAESSFEAWTKYYRADDNTPNITVSYYTKGALVGLCLDLRLRQMGHSLDAVMRGLWQRCAGGPMDEGDLLAVLHAVSGEDWRKALHRWVHGTADLPLKELLGSHGVQVHIDPSAWAQRLGLRVGEGPGVQLKFVFTDGAAQRAGMAPGDEWIGIELPASKGHAASAWRLQKIDELGLYLGSGKRCTALVARDQQLLRLPLVVPAANDPRVGTWRLGVTDAKALQHWLD
jgi:predicted metalloprotease with PDZ domain